MPVIAPSFVLSLVPNKDVEPVDPWHPNSPTIQTSLRRIRSSKLFPIISHFFSLFFYPDLHVKYRLPPPSPPLGALSMKEPRKDPQESQDFMGLCVQVCAYVCVCVCACVCVRQDMWHARSRKTVAPRNGY